MKSVFIQSCKFLLLWLPVLLFGQTSPSGQAKFITPSLLSSCNKDTICLEITNLQGAKNTTYSGNVTLEIDIPGDTLIGLETGSVFSLPAGAIQVSYVGNKLIMSVPLPALGSTTKVCFVVRPDCNVTNMVDLPNFNGKITYPPAFPTPTETFESGDLNVGTAILSVGPATITGFFNKTYSRNASFQRGIKITNGGYGNIDNLTITVSTPNDLTFSSSGTQSINAAWDLAYAMGIVPFSSTIVGSKTIRIYKLSGVQLGPDHILAAGEAMHFSDTHIAPNYCGAFDSDFKVEYGCGANAVSCDVPQTITDRTSVQSGTPKLTGEIVTFQSPNGCANRHVKYTIINNGSGTTAIALDAVIKVAFGSQISVSNVTIDGASTTATVDLAGNITIAPLPAADLNNDGKWDKILLNEIHTIDFDYTFLCQAACGNSIFRNMMSVATFTDECRLLNGSTITPLIDFGFRQLSPFTQNSINYTCQGDGTFDTLRVVQTFDFQAVNYDLTGSTGRVVIRFSNSMNFDPNSVYFNGSLVSVMMGPDSAYFDLDNAQFTALLTAGKDSLEYKQELICGIVRPNNVQPDNFSLMLNLNGGGACTGCPIDLACGRGLKYGTGPCCGPVRCLTQQFFTIERLTSGSTDAAETTPIVFDKRDTWMGDTVLFTSKWIYSGPNYNVTSEYALMWNLDMFLQKKIGVPYSYEAPIVPLDMQVRYNLETACNRTYVKTSTPTSNVPAYTVPYPGGSLFLAGLYETYGPNYGVQDQFFTPRIEGDKSGYSYESRYGWSGNPFYLNPVHEQCHPPKLVWSNGDSIMVQMKVVVNRDFDWENVLGNVSIGSSGSLDKYNYNAFSGDKDYVGDCAIKYNDFLAYKPITVISNPNEVYNADCGLDVCHNIEFTGYNGDYFSNEFRSQFRIDSIVVDIPSEYGITGTPTFKYNQSCATATVNEGAGNFTRNASTGHVVFEGDLVDNFFPKSDDCAGYQNPYALCYTIAKTGTAAATKYKMPIRIFGKDDYGDLVILTDTATISEADPTLVLNSITPILQVTDGGACQPAIFDFTIKNSTLFDAPFTYFAAEGTATTTIFDITDAGVLHADAIVLGDVTSYATNSKFAKLGTIKSGETRLVRVLATTNICADSIKVFTDFGCFYPTPLQPNLASTTLKQTTTKYDAVPPAILSRPMGDINIMNLCDNKTIEIEVKNAKLGNIYKLMAGFKLPTGANYVPNSAMIKHSATTGTYIAIPAADVAMATADSLVINLTNSSPFSTLCGLAGSDTTIQSILRLKFDIAFAACPNSSLGQISFKVQGENYCGKKTSSRGNIRLNYIGAGGNKNNYTLSPTTKSIDLCALKNGVQSFIDTLFIKNVGGFGPLSGSSSGLDSMELTIPFDLNSFTLTNFMVLAPFNSPVFGTNSLGQMTIRVLVPAGVAVGSTISMPMTFDISPKKDSICLVDADPHLCFFAQYSAPVILECASKSLFCNAVSKAPVGTGVSLRAFNCCFGSIGDYVWLDCDKDGLQGSSASEMPVFDLTVFLLNNLGAVIDSTKTDSVGKYLFPNLFTGIYQVKFKIPSNYIVTSPNNPADDTKDSDAGANGFSHLISINGSLAQTDTLRNNLHVDLGLIAVLTPTISGELTFCAGDSTRLTAAGGTTFLWSNGQTAASIYVKTAGNYTVTVADATGCTGTKTVEIIENPVIIETFCPGNTFVLDAGAGLTDIQWFKNGVAIPSATNQIYIANSIGKYHYEANETANGCPTASCCPVQIVNGVCPVCPLKVCLPVRTLKH
jgi:SdrD B-like domain